MRIFGNIPIDNNPKGYNMSIYCVENPAVLDSLKTIFFSIEQVDRTIIYANYINDIEIAISNYPEII